MKIKQVLIIVFAAIIGGLISVYFVSSGLEKKYQRLVEESKSEQSGSVQYTSMPAALPAGDVNFIEAAEKSVHGVVHVKTQYHTNDSYYDNMLFDFFFGNGSYATPQPQVGSGSGVIISSDGYIVTNNHVIDNSDQISVVLNNNKKYTANLVGTDPTTDIALLKIDSEDELPFISFGNSDELKVGQWVLAVGNPFNLTSTVTAGIVSAKARNINILSKNYSIESFIQTDAAVNPGNSGGALVDNNGRLVGINTAIASRTGSYIGYSFAVPVNIVKKVVSDIIEFGEVQRAFIGVSIRDVDSELANELNMDNVHGVYVSQLTEGGAAKDAGIEEGDVILEVGSVGVNSMSELQEQVSMYRPGDEASVTVFRGGKIKNFIVVLRNKHGNTDVVKNNNIEILGATLVVPSKTELSRLRISGGAKIEEIAEGKLKSAGIKEKFIISKINGRRVQSPSEVYYILKDISGGVYIEGIYPNGLVAYYAFGM